MCDRVLVFSTNPGRIVSEIKVDLPHPRDRVDPVFSDLVERIYVALTARPVSPARTARLDSILPRISTTLLAGLADTLAAPPYEGAADLPALASALHMEVDDLFHVAETLQSLRFAEVEGGDIRLTEAGKRFAVAPLDEAKALFQRHLLAHVPLAAHIRRVLDERESHTAPRTRFLDELEDHMTPQAAEQTLDAVVGWGRYAEAFAYDDDLQQFSLENPS